MKIALMSRDTDLDRLCREILGELSMEEWSLFMAPAVDCPVECDLYIWDGAPSDELLEKLKFTKGLTKHLFLVHRNDLAACGRLAEVSDANILLKPVTKATLLVFLSAATSAHTAAPLSDPESLRADRDRMLQYLIDANLKLQEYDQDRTNFLTRAVHDFRAPLTALSGYCGLLLNRVLGPLTEDQKEVIERMQHSTKRLSRMASAMFELSVGRQIKRQPELSKGDIRECVDQAMHEIAPFLEGKRIAVCVNLEPEPGAVYFERGQVEQLLINLLDNACKFTPKDGAIDIHGYPFFWERRTAGGCPAAGYERRLRHSRRFNSYRIDIGDSGPLIPPEHLQKIFEEYTSYAGGQDRSGGGLGLAICRMIAKLHHGRIWAENTEAGPRFSFVLPVQTIQVEAIHQLEALMESR